MIRKSFLQALFFLFFYPSFCDQWLHQPRVVVLHFRGILQAGQCCSPGALLGDVLLLIITLHHSPSGYHWIIIIAFFSSVGLTQSFSPGDFSVGSSVGRGSLVRWWAQSTGGNVLFSDLQLFFSCFPLTVVLLCPVECWYLHLQVLTFPSSVVTTDSEAKRAAYTMLTAWGFELAAAPVLKKDASQLWDLVSVDSSNGSAELEVTNLNLQYFSSW